MRGKGGGGEGGGGKGGKGGGGESSWGDFCSHNFLRGGVGQETA